MRLRVVAPIVVVVLVGCGSNVDPTAGPSGGTSTADTATPVGVSSARIAKCVDRIVRRILPSDAATSTVEETRRYVDATYCARFEQAGWVHEDGTLELAAYREFADPADQETGAPKVLDCALLHYVRRNAVRTYVRMMRRAGPVSCDDGTAVDELGVP